MTLAIFKIIYYVGLIVFCLVSLLALRHINRFSYLGKASRPVMVFYIVISLVIIIFIQVYISRIDWDQPLFGSVGFSPKETFSSYRGWSATLSDRIQNFISGITRY